MEGKSLEVVLLDVLEVSVCVYLQFSYCKLICNDDSVRMCLKCRQSACLRICSLDGSLECIGLLMTESEYEYLLCVHYCTDAYCKSCSRNLAEISVEET